MAEGIRERHSRKCASNDAPAADLRHRLAARPAVAPKDRRELREQLRARLEAACDCKPSYEVSVYSRRDGKKIRRTFATQTDARRWRRAIAGEVDAGRVRAPSPTTIAQAAPRWLELARDGVIRNRSDDRYKPSVIAGYEELLTLRLLPELGPVRLSELARPTLQLLVGEWQARGLSASTIRNTLMPLRAIYRDLELLGILGVPVNPTAGLRLPRVDSGRVRIVSPGVAELFLATVPSTDRPLWATAFYAGLRRGELAAVPWSDVDLAGGTIRVEWSYDFKTKQFVAPKSRAGRRRVPIPAVLRDVLVELRLDHERAGRSDGLVFGEDAEAPFRPSGVERRGAAAWKALGLVPIGLHPARHTFASLMIAAGVNAKALCTFMGHSSIQITFDRYGHLMPGSEAEAAALLDRYLTEARAEAARKAGAELAGAQTGAQD